jgi:hypothetical protein
LKPAVIVLSEEGMEEEGIFKEGDKERIINNVREKQERLDEQKRLKKALSKLPEKDE